MNKSIGLFILQISVALYLFATGILGLTGNWYRDGEIRRAVSAIFRGNIAEIIIVIIAICAVAAGVLLLLDLFNIELEILDLVLLILMIVWVVFIFLVDIYYPLNNRVSNFVDYLRQLGSHLMVLGGMACVSRRFGGR